MLSSRFMSASLRATRADICPSISCSSRRTSSAANSFDTELALVDPELVELAVKTELAQDVGVGGRDGEEEVSVAATCVVGDVPDSEGVLLSYVSTLTSSLSVHTKVGRRPAGSRTESCGVASTFTVLSVFAAAGTGKGACPGLSSVMFEAEEVLASEAWMPSSRCNTSSIRCPGARKLLAL